MGTEDKIVCKALALFNEKGIEYVGMRELAASLDTKLGNITYYFPTKEDLLLRLSMDLSALNSSVLQVDEDLGIRSYLEMTRRHFEGQYQYRCLFVSFVHLLRQYPKLSNRYKKIERLRIKTAEKIIHNLVRNKYLKKLSQQETEFLLSSILFLSRFWISESAISHYRLKPVQQINHYLKLLANILSDYCTSKGKEEITRCLDM